VVFPPAPKEWDDEVRQLQLHTALDWNIRHLRIREGKLRYDARAKGSSGAGDFIYVESMPKFLWSLHEFGDARPVCTSSRFMHQVS
jgi:hypothetical protein